LYNTCTCRRVRMSALCAHMRTRPCHVRSAVGSTSATGVTCSGHASQSAQRPHELSGEDMRECRYAGGQRRVTGSSGKSAHGRGGGGCIVQGYVVRSYGRAKRSQPDGTDCACALRLTHVPSDDRGGFGRRLQDARCDGERLNTARRANEGCVRLAHFSSILLLCSSAATGFLQCALDVRRRWGTRSARGGATEHRAESPETELKP